MEATFEQKKCATVFFTFSYADNHWDDLHKLMPGIITNDKKSRYQNVLDNPHLVDWYFSYRLNEFLKVVFDGILDCEWRWHRFEWQSRTSIHAHGAAKFRNDPGLVELTTKVFEGREAEKKLNLPNNSNEEIDKLRQIIMIGIESEKIVITYTDTLITAMNPRKNPHEYNNVVPEPHPCSLDPKLIKKIDSDKDYESVINCCQRHVCRPDGYCKTDKKDQICRFHYPMEECQKTKIVFIEKGNSIKAQILLKRNDCYMNMHNRLIAHNWRGNVDLQIILDQAAAISYMVKYATKGEKAGSSLNDLYRSVIFYSKEDDKAVTKLRSLMLKTVSGKRDLGQCEVSRLLMSGPLYSSSFEYITQSLELTQSKLLNNLNNHGKTEATVKSLIEYYANRKDEYLLNFNDFVTKYKITKGLLSLRLNPEKIIIVTYPKVRFNIKINEIYTDYCFFQLIKYKPWLISELDNLKNKLTAITRWEEFIKTAPDNIKNTIK